MIFRALAILTLAGAALAVKTCQNQTVSVTIAAVNALFDTSLVPHSDIEVTGFIQRWTRHGSNLTNDGLTGYANVSGAYNISTQYCKDSSANPETVQILTHGIGFDRSYWDLSFNNFNYSYVNAAINAGFATLSFDRLGTGASQIGTDPLNEIQAYLEIQVLRALTTKLRNGTFPGVTHTFSSIVHVGHSFGSIQTYTFAARYPNETQGIVLTGFSMDGSYVGYFGSGGDFEAAGGDHPAGYLSTANAGAIQYQFLLPPFFDAAILDFLQAGAKPVTIGELLTLGASPPTNAFTGPVLVFTGSGDLPFCGGDCLLTGDASPSIPDKVRLAFTNIQPANFQAYIQPSTGHGLTAHFNATAGYQVILEWLQTHGLGSSPARIRKRWLSRI
ncbi:hypothetical protein HKX48_000284 [Thoreauomyces humboldtii]|nr:hypothetical protein HKX48_000284 [Thoreauomyces humboldtii]